MKRPRFTRKQDRVVLDGCGLSREFTRSRLNEVVSGFLSLGAFVDGRSLFRAFVRSVGFGFSEFVRRKLLRFFLAFLCFFTFLSMFSGPLNVFEGVDFFRMLVLFFGILLEFRAADEGVGIRLSLRLFVFSLDDARREGYGFFFIQASLADRRFGLMYMRAPGRSFFGRGRGAFRSREWFLSRNGSRLGLRTAFR